MRSNVIAFLVVLSVSTTARATGITVQFPFEDAERLYPYQHDGGIAYIAGTPPATAKVPLVVFLHGNNTQAQTHMWMAGVQDLRPLASRLAADAGPFVLAAPSQTKDATNAATLWNDLDLDDFVTKTATAIGDVSIDRDRVYVIAHSGAGCNVSGGITRAAHARVRAVMALDTCLDEETGRAFAPLTRLWVLWQSKTWPRDIAAFERGLGYASVGVRIDEIEVEGRGAHDAIVYEGFTRAIRTWL